MSLFNTANAGIKAYTDFCGGRDDLGVAFEHHTIADRRAYLRRNPQIDAQSLPSVRDVNARPTISDAVGSVNGQPLRTPARIREEAARGALLCDPITSVRKHEPTRPVAKLEPPISLYRSSVHECGHLLTSFALDVATARVSLIKNGDSLGYVKHAILPDSEQHLAILLGGRAGELVEFGDVRMVGCETDMRDAKAMAQRLAGDGADELIERTLQRVVNMLQGAKDVMRYLAYELINKRQIDFENVDAAIDRAFARSEKKAAAKAAPKQAPATRRFDFSKPEDVRAFNVKMGRDPNSEPIGYTQGYILNGAAR